MTKDHDAIRRAAFAAALSSADKSRLLTAGSANQVAGLPIPFALELLLDCNVLPLGVVFELLAEPGVGKTTFGYELGRIIYEYGGWTEMFLTEGKISPILSSAIMGYEDECLREGKPLPFFSHQSMDMQDWQAQTIERVKFTLNLWQKGGTVNDVKIPKGAYQPVQYLVDSIMGQNLRATDEKVADEGAGGRGYAIEAGSLTTYLRTIQKYIAAGPFILTLINHLKPQPASQPFMPPELNSPGGKQVRFQATYRIGMKKGSQFAHVTDPGSAASLVTRGHVIHMFLLKNSLGSDSNRISVPYQWTFVKDEVTGETKQRSEFVWSAALVKYLLDEVHEGLPKQIPNTQKAKAALVERLDSVVHFRQIKKGKFTSKTFGVTSEAPMTTRELGDAIQQSPEILEGLRDLFGVKRYTVWNPDENYFALKDRMAKAVDKLATQLPQSVKSSR
ncbi:MAG: hypothetical protein KatS3mg109_0157 [Pirellulaceae bacterium]|nr:MAG: hypothetical protein KatS3mg109_0157 [Pirellulaceae bacterium]